MRPQPELRAHLKATIRRAVNNVRGQGSRIGEPKTPGSRRSIPMPESLVRALTAHRRAQAERALRLGAAYDREADLVFANEAGGLLQLRNMRMRHFKPAVDRAGLPSPT